MLLMRNPERNKIIAFMHRSLIVFFSFLLILFDSKNVYM